MSAACLMDLRPFSVGDLVRAARAASKTAEHLRGAASNELAELLDAFAEGFATAATGGGRGAAVAADLNAVDPVALFDLVEELEAARVDLRAGGDEVLACLLGFITTYLTASIPEVH